MKLDHIAFQVSDMDRALEFYTEMLGFELMFDKTSEEHRERFAFLRLEGANLELLEKHDDRGRPIPYSPPSPEPPYCPHAAIATDDLDGLIHLLAEKEVPILEGPLEIEGEVRWFYFCDPDNNVLEFVEWCSSGGSGG